MLKTYRYDAIAAHSARPKGPHLLVLGAVHGNETCGPAGIYQLIQALDTGTIVLDCGRVTLLPIANPQAYQLQRRFVDRNLNRALYAKAEPQAYEDFLDASICNLIESADVLLDLHSYASLGGPFAFLGHTHQQEIDFCRHLGVDNFVYGWADAFGQANTDPKESMGTVEYARSVGVFGTTVECGHHTNEDAPAVALTTILNALLHLQMIDQASDLAINLNIKQQPLHQLESQCFVQMQSVFYKQASGRLTHPWQHYAEVEAGQQLAVYDSGDTIIAPTDGYIVLPKLHAAIGGEWFYFGIATSCPMPLDAS